MHGGVDMFENPGKTIRNYAKFVFWFTVAAAVVIALLVSISSEQVRWDEVEYSFDFLQFICIVAISIPIALIECLFLDAFGELVCSTKENAAKTAQLLAECRILERKLNSDNNGAEESNVNNASKAPASSKPAADTAAKSDNRSSTAKQFVENALSKDNNTVMFGYVSWNFGKLDKEAAEALAAIKPFIDSNDKEGLRDALTAINEKLG